MHGAWKDEVRTVLVQNLFTSVSCPQTQIHKLVYLVLRIPKDDPNGMQHLPKLLNDCGCPSELYSTCHVPNENILIE
jgi:hypothetical protein